MLSVKKPSMADLSFIDDVLKLDLESYDEKYRGTKESVLARFEKNSESYILLYDNKKIVGYICFFPINEDFAAKIRASDVIFDDNISPSDICNYNTVDSLNIYIISICIQKAYRGGDGVKLLMRGLAQFVKNKLSQCVKINKIIASATSEKGKSTLVRAGFSPVKESDDFTLFETQPHAIDLGIKSDVFIFSQCIKIDDDEIINDNRERANGKQNTKNVDGKMKNGNGEIKNSNSQRRSANSQTKDVDDEIKNGKKDDYVKALEETTNYEFVEHIATHINRCFLQDVDIVVMSDEDRVISQTPVQGKMYLTAFNGIYVITLQLRDLEIDPTYLLDQSASDRLIVSSTNGGENVPYNKFLRDTYSLNKIGMNRNCVILNERLFPEYMTYLLASEAYNSDYMSDTLTSGEENKKFADTNIVAREYMEKAGRNIAQYDMGEIYAADKTVVEVLRVRFDLFENRFKCEKLLIFIIEMLSLQSCSIEQINNSVLFSIGNSEKDNFAAEQEFFEFGQTYQLWNLNYYKYSLSHNLHAHLEKEFKIEEIKRAYESSRATLKIILQTKNEIKNKKTAGKINLLLLIFTLLSGFNTLIGFIGQFVVVSSVKFPQTANLIVSCVIFFIFLVTFIFVKYGDNMKHWSTKHKKPKK